MKRASLQYKQAMAKQFRDKAYALVSVGVVNKQAQANIQMSDILYLSDTKNPLRKGRVYNTYATFEENSTPADGSYIFPPEDNEYFQLATGVGAISNDILGGIRINLNIDYDIKGLTIDFGKNYPTEFTVTTNNVTHTYTNESQYFTCTDNFDGTTFFIITPLHFINGDNKRLRINYILMGIGLMFDNDDIVDLSFSDSVSYVSEELPAMNFSIKVIDDVHLFDVDDTSSFINYLIDGQELECALGQRLADGTVEYIELPTTYLSDWSADTRYMSFTATDRFVLMDKPYSGGNHIHTRTLYDDAIAVLTDAGLEPDEYFVDSCLQDITVTNPLPTVSHKECLQLIANAGRCSLRQGKSGKILINSNFENIIEPTDLVTYANREADWSKADNVRFGTDIVYADFTKDFAPADGSMLFLPENSEDYLDTAFVSKDIADENGDFEINPTLTMKLPALFTYYGLQVLFNGNHPLKVTMQTYYDDTLLATYEYDVTEDLYVFEEMISFNKLVFTFTKGQPHDRILVNKISLGELTDYTLDRDSMKGEPLGSMERKVKDVQVKVFSFKPPSEEGQEPEQVDDSVYYVHNLHSTGQTVTFENQLIGSMEHAQMVAEWMANYYANTISYKVDYRGDPRIDASDIIYMESKLLNNLQVEVESHELKFDGAYSGTLNLRRATNMLVKE